MKKSNAAALARYASQLTGGGREMIDILVSIARDPLNTASERTAAVREVIDRTCGKAALVIDAEVTVKGRDLDVSRLTPGRLAEIRAGLRELALASGVPVPCLPEARAPRVIDVVAQGGPAVDPTNVQWDEGEEPEPDEDA